MLRKLASAVQPITIAFLFFPIAVFFFCALLPEGTQYRVWMPLLSLIGMNAAAWALAALPSTRIRPITICLILALLALAMGYWTHTLGMQIVGSVLWTAITFAGAVLTAVRVSRDTMDMSVAHLALAGLVLYGVNYLISYLMYRGYDILYAGEILTQTAPYAVFWLLATIWIAVIFHAHSLNANRGRKTPRRVLVFNCCAAGIFTILVVSMYFIDFLRRAVDALLEGIVWLVYKITELLGKLIYGDTPVGEGTAGGDMGDIGAVLGAEAHQETLFDIIFMYLMEAVVVIGLIAAAAFLAWKLFGFLKKLIQRANGFLNSWEAGNQAYIDEREDLMNAEIFRQEWEDRMARLRRRFTPKVRLSDLPDDRARVRMLYQWMLERSARKGEWDASRTASEYLADSGSEAKDFAAAYAAARYSEHEVSAEDVARGERVYRKP